jgi:hypothetical protein
LPLFVAKRNEPLGEAGLSRIAANSPQTYPQKMCTTGKSTDRLTSYGDFTEIGRARWGKCQYNVKSKSIVIMEEIFWALVSLVELMLHWWRISLGALAATILAVVLSNSIPPFTAGYCVTLIILGTALGIYWQIRANSGRKKNDKT